MSSIWGVVRFAGNLSERELEQARAAFPASGTDCFLAPRAVLFREGSGTAADSCLAVPKTLLVADVRLDDREDLIRRLSGKRDSDISDNVILLHAYRKWGASLTRELCGDYALAVWDDERAELFCARDHIGTRPLYYSATPDRFCFASHIRTLLAIPGVSSDLDEDFISGVLHNEYDRTVQTYFKSIKKVPLGHSLTARRGGVHLSRHWDPWQAPDIRFGRDSEYVEAARDLLSRAVSDRLRNVNRVGVHLSGGLDSSSIAVLAAREQRRNGKPAPVAFSWQPPPRDVVPIPWEHSFIGAVSVQESIPVHYCEIIAGDMLEVLREDPARDPVAQAQFVELTVQKRAASLGVKTILSGWGGDEGLSYYGRAYHADLFLRGRWIRSWQDARCRPGPPLGRVAGEVLSAVHPELPDVLFALLKGKRYRTGWNNFVHPDFARRVRPRKPRVWRESSIRARLASAWASGVHADRMESWYCHGARRGIVYAYPLLDRRILEFAAGLPPEQFVRQSWTRWLMRNTLEGILPRELCWHEDKDEPLLFPVMIRTVEHVMEKIGEALTAAPQLPPRSKYVDMTELLRRLRPEAIRNDPRAGGLLRTVKFLELEGTQVEL